MSVLQRKGLYPPPVGESSILGLEAAGIVEKLGPSCTTRWRVGDRVMALLPGDSLRFRFRYHLFDQKYNIYKMI